MIEIVSFREFQKNTLQGFLTVRLSSVSLEIRDITVHAKSGERWLSLPSKQYEADGQTKWFPIIRFTEKETWNKFKTATLKALDKHLANSNPNQKPSGNGIPF